MIIDKDCISDLDFSMRGNWLFWRSKAKELKRGAKVLFAEAKKDIEILKQEAEEVLPPSFPKDIFFVSVMLAGFSIENMIKGIIVIDHPEYLKGGKIKGITNHDILKLFGLAELMLSDEEEKLCNLLILGISWFGRYPIPKRKEDELSRVKVGYNEFETGYDDLFARLHNEMDSRLKCRTSTKK